MGIGLPGRESGAGLRGRPRAIDATDPSEELAEFLRQARTIDFSLSEARNRFVDIDRYRIEILLSFMADYDVIVCPAMPTQPNHTTTDWSRSATSLT